MFGKKPGEKPGELKLVSTPQFEEASNPDSASGPSDDTEKTAKASKAASAAPGPSRLKQGRCEATAEGGHDSGASERRRPPPWLFFLVVAVFAAGLGWQFRVAGQLEREIGRLEQELRETHVLLGAHKSRLFEIRGGVHDLATRLEGLRALVDADPGEAAQGLAAPGVDPGASIPARLPAE